MEYSINGADRSSVNITSYEGGIWISLWRQCGYAATHLTKEQAEQLRDALIALTMETADATQ
jgi:hypothetical protein